MFDLCVCILELLFYCVDVYCLSPLIFALLQQNFGWEQFVLVVALADLIALLYRKQKGQSNSSSM